MSNSIRLLPPPKGLGVNPISNGVTTYSAAPGSVLNVPYPGDTDFLVANGWIPTAGFGGRGQASIGLAGATADRPKMNGEQILFPGTQYLDTTLAALIVWDGETWRNPLTGASV